jgi:hypothetical protein
MRSPIFEQACGTEAEGPSGYGHGRKAVVGDLNKMSAESAALDEQLFMEYRTFGALLLRNTDPGLTAGPIYFRPIGPHTVYSERVMSSPEPTVSRVGCSQAFRRGSFSLVAGVADVVAFDPLGMGI